MGRPRKRKAGLLTDEDLRKELLRPRQKRSEKNTSKVPWSVDSVWFVTFSLWLKGPCLPGQVTKVIKVPRERSKSGHVGQVSSIETIRSVEKGPSPSDPIPPTAAELGGHIQVPSRDSVAYGTDGDVSQRDGHFTCQGSLSSHGTNPSRVRNFSGSQNDVRESILLWMWQKTSTR